MNDSQLSIVPESRYGTEYSETWQQDVFFVLNSAGEKFYLHTANITIEGDEFASLTFRRQIRRGAQPVLPDTHIVVEAGGVPRTQLTRKVAAEVDVDDYSMEL